ncbi:MAG: hypothetical protein JSR18_09495 [Proteobacteria bacterium]|nr:hypothetical protein [Pseudomonadota bacterium]
MTSRALLAAAVLVLGTGTATLLPARATAADPALPDDVVSTIRKANVGGALATLSAWVDLDGDVQPELLVYVVGPGACGTGGCTLWVFARNGSEYRVVGKIGPVQTPVRVGTGTGAGWRDLVVAVGGGGARAGWRQLVFDGRTYPRNPTVMSSQVKTAAAGEGDIVIPELHAFSDATPLPPAR